MVKKIFILLFSLLFFVTPVCGLEGDLKILETSLDENKQILALKNIRKEIKKKHLKLLNNNYSRKNIQQSVVNIIDLYKSVDKTIPPLLIFLEDGLGPVNLEVIYTLGEVGAHNPNKVIPVLIELLKDKRSLVRVYALKSLISIEKKIGFKEATVSLFDLKNKLFDKSPFVRELALFLLISIGSEERHCLDITKNFVKLSNDKNIYVQDIGLEGLIQLSERLGVWAENEREALAIAYCSLIREGVSKRITRSIFITLLSQVRVKGKIVAEPDDFVIKVIEKIKKNEVTETGICIFLNMMMSFSSSLKQKTIILTIKTFLFHKVLEIKKATISLVRSLNQKNKESFIPDLKKLIDEPKLKYRLSYVAGKLGDKNAADFYLAMGMSKNAEVRKYGIRQIKYMRNKGVSIIPKLKIMKLQETDKEVKKQFEETIEYLEIFKKNKVKTPKKTIKPWQMPFERMP